jgi:hypothetical protein
MCVKINLLLILPLTPPPKGELKKSSIFFPEQPILKWTRLILYLSENFVGHDSPFGGG